ncbi:MAG: type IV toxin-antitoxin system AbiEi family antitoxin domain-containing protein [Thermomicrobiales bacterium]
MSWDDLLATAAAQHGYFTAAQAAEQGISRRALSWRAQHGSAGRVGHGLYRLPHWPPDPSDELYSLQVIAPFGTFSHDTALTLLGMTDIIPSTIHFTIPETSRLRSRRGVTLHRSRHGGTTDRTLRDGLWVSTARRALLDAARDGADPDQLVSAARDARARAMLTPDDLAELRRNPPFAGARL